MPRMSAKKCIHCFQSDDTEFHEIFDKVGIELGLDQLLEQHFQLKVTPSRGNQPVLCDKCVNQLIEIFDIAEKQKEQEIITSDVDDVKAEVWLLEEGTEDSKASSSQVIETEYDGEADAVDGCTTETLVDTFDVEKDGISEWDDATTVIDYDEYDELKEETEEKFAEQQIDCCENKDDEEFDYAAMQQYADGIINSNFEDLQLEYESKCNICSDAFTQHQDLLLHIEDQHKDENGFYPCVLDNCQQLIESERLLARHIVLKHYDLRGISIFGSCSNCGMSYSNFLHFNKHSCCRTLKCKGRTPNYCGDCKTDFPTFRRYRFHMQFHMKNPRPKVCLLCDRFFKDGEEFFEHVHYDHESPNEMICTKCDRMYNNKKLFESHMASHNLALKFQCNLCTKAYSRKQWLKIHMQTHDEIKCEICNKIFSTKDYFRNHMKLHQAETDVLISFCTACGQIGLEEEDLQEHIEDANSKCYRAEIDQGFVDEVYFCEYCETVFKGKEYLKQHRATGVHQDKIYRCHACTATFDELRKVRAHFKLHKYFIDWRKSLPLLRIYMCDVGDCEQSYAMWLSLHSHKIMKHKELRLICSGCNSKFTNKNELDTHSAKCQKDGMFVCSFCGKQYPSKMSRSVHIARSHNNKNFNCTSCKASFKDEESLTKHVEFIHVAMECKICRKKIKNKRNLLLHERVKHEQEKRHFCETCKKGFYNKSDMEAHERTAHSAISYVCEKCPFTTNYKNSLDIHMAKHNNDLQFKCSICNRKFARKRVMELHVKRHQVEKEFVCAEYGNYSCTASFITRHLLNKHIKEKHSSGFDCDKGPAKKRSRKHTTNNLDTTENSSDPDDPEYKTTTDETDEYLTYICYENQEEAIDFAIEETASQQFDIPQDLVTECLEDADFMSDDARG